MNLVLSHSCASYKGEKKTIEIQLVLTEVQSLQTHFTMELERLYSLSYQGQKSR